MAKTPIISGSFDPITMGHHDLILRTEKLFGSVIVVLSANTEKHAMFSAQCRFDSLKALYADSKSIKVALLDGLLSCFVKQNDGFLVRGVRNVNDFVYEENLYEINRELDGVETLLLPASPEYGFISSTFARDMIIYRRDPQKYIPDKAWEVLKNGINHNC